MRLSLLNRKPTKTAALFLVVILLGIAFLFAVSPLGSLATLALVAGTFFLIRPELGALIGGRGDRRPWLVRLREHEWRRVPVPLYRPVPRLFAYAVLFLAWWWWLG